MIQGFYESLAALCRGESNPLIAIALSDDAATYLPEMKWLAEQLQLQGKRVFCLKTQQLFPLGSTLCFDLDGNPEKVDVLYRFFELFDLPNIKIAPFILESWKAGELVIAPPMRHFQEEKLAFALFHHHRLRDFWTESLSKASFKILQRLIPQSWVMDSAPLPPGAVLEGPLVGGHKLTEWRDLIHASQKERDLIIKISGYHETAWGARSVVLGSDCSREEWQFGIEQALDLASQHLHVLQVYKKPRRASHPLYMTRQSDGNPSDSPTVAQREGRLRLCPYYFVTNNKVKLSGALATFCPPDKKIIHGMQDAALLPCQVS